MVLFLLEQDIYKATDEDLLLLVTAAGWCTACREEQPALEDLYQTTKTKASKYSSRCF